MTNTYRPDDDDHDLPSDDMCTADRPERRVSMAALLAEARALAALGNMEALARVTAEIEGRWNSEAGLDE